jgi:cytochrome c oxidase subunit 2
MLPAIVVWVIGLIVVVLGAQRWMPELASDHGAGIDVMLHYILYCVGALILIGHGLLGWFLWTGSKRKSIRFRLAEHRVERNWSLIPMVVMALVAEGGVLVLGLPVWAKIYGPPPEDSLVIEVVGEQFAWNVRYPGPDGKFGRQEAKLMSLENPIGLDEKDPASKDDILTLNSIHVPVNKPVKIRLKSKDVLHSFYLPHLRVKQDAVPGMTIEFWFVPTRNGQFELACAELCGFGHYEMGGMLTVESEEEFQKWLKENSNG